LEGATTWSTVAKTEIRSVCFAFHKAHAECGTLVHIERGEFALVCWCERCRDLRAYGVEEGRPSDSRSAFSVPRAGR
jgi:hypothetical protein